MSVKEGSFQVRVFALDKNDPRNHTKLNEQHEFCFVCFVDRFP
ncbi:MAG: hypothetical protein QOH71_2628 [Blastocatellia bacterium]|jgi:hypothetical protein|nr:hypothetical protein [Blastocatellia bacterium]